MSSAVILYEDGITNKSVHQVLSCLPGSKKFPLFDYRIWRGCSGRSEGETWRGCSERSEGIRAFDSTITKPGADVPNAEGETWRRCSECSEGETWRGCSERSEGIRAFDSTIIKPGADVPGAARAYVPSIQLSQNLARMFRAQRGHPCLRFNYHQTWRGCSSAARASAPSI